MASIRKIPVKCCFNPNNTYIKEHLIFIFFLFVPKFSLQQIFDLFNLIYCLEKKKFASYVSKSITWYTATNWYSRTCYLSCDFTHNHRYQADDILKFSTQYTSWDAVLQKIQYPDHMIIIMFTIYVRCKLAPKIQSDKSMKHVDLCVLLLFVCLFVCLFAFFFFFFFWMKSRKSRNGVAFKWIILGYLFQLESQTVL